MQQHHKRGQNRTAALNMVSLMDIFTILVFFLLVNATSAEVLPSPKNIVLPEAAAEKLPSRNLVIAVDRQVIRLQGEAIITVKDALKGKQNSIKPLFSALRQVTGTDKSIATSKGVTIMGDQEILAAEKDHADLRCRGIHQYFICGEPEGLGVLMAKAVATPEPNLPWVDHQEDRSFRWLMIIMMILFLGTGLILDAIKLPELVQKNLVDVSPRLAKLILEKQKVKPPPPKKIIPKKEKPKEKKKSEKKKEKPKEKKKPEKKKEKPKQVKKEDARDVAKKSGLIALSDELADLRESFDLDDTLKLPQQTTGKQAAKIETASNLLSAGAQQSSGGIQTDTLNRTIKTSELAQRQTTKVESKIETSEQKLAKASTTQQQQKKGTLAKRTTDEIERVFQKNKASIFNLYNRALRKNPLLSGQVVVELTISPSGTVTAVKILSSELGDEKLERKLVIKIKKFTFTKANVAEITVTYPIDFLPS